MYKTQSHTLLVSFIGIAILCFFMALIVDVKFLFLLPFGLLLGYVAILDYRFLYLLLFATIPFSIEVELPGGLGTDIPTEPLMLLLTGIAIVLFLSKVKSIDAKYIQHPILMLLLVHLSWIFITSITSLHQLVSIKFLLAKVWYVIPFYFLSLHLFSQNKHVYQWMKVLSITVAIAVIYVNVRHAQYGFSFAKVNKSVAPIFRNHVNYASLLALFLPFVWALFQKERERKYLLLIGLILVSIYFSYTRVAYATALLLPLIYMAVKWRLLKPAVWIGVISIPFIVIFFVRQNNYLNYAPDYNKTVMNYDFDDLLSATYKMEDLSTMERVYRWVAGARMIGDKPFMGFGPSTFYENYKDYVVTDFQTYVSDNPEKSGIHNYFLMTTVEQGIIGFLIFLSLLVISLFTAHRVYQLATEDDKRIIMASTLSLISIIMILLINDMVESDKLGPFLFLNMALLTHYDIKYKKREVS